MYIVSVQTIPIGSWKTKLVENIVHIMPGHYISLYFVAIMNQICYNIGIFMGSICYEYYHNVAAQTRRSAFSCHVVYKGS